MSQPFCPCAGCMDGVPLDGHRVQRCPGEVFPGSAGDTGPDYTVSPGPGASAGGKCGARVGASPCAGSRAGEGGSAGHTWNGWERAARSPAGPRSSGTFLQSTRECRNAPYQSLPTREGWHLMLELALQSEKCHTGTTVGRSQASQGSVASCQCVPGLGEGVMQLCLLQVPPGAGLLPWVLEGGAEFTMCHHSETWTSSTGKRSSYHDNRC